MTMDHFISDNRAELDDAIHSVAPGIPLDDEDREEWIMNDEGLYMWAEDAGVDV